MKKITIIIVLALLCLNFRVHSQPKPLLQTLKTGDEMPDLAIQNVINNPVNSIHLSDYSGKLLILDFWATWCAPCVAMIPRMNQLQDQFNGKVQFLPVAYQDQATVSKFLTRLADIKKIQTRLPVVTEDKVLVKLFPHTYLPHYVWISGSGKVIAITDEKNVTAANIESYLKGDDLALKEKRDPDQVPYDSKKALFFNNNGGDGQIVKYHSLFTGFNESLSGLYQLSAPDSLNGRKFTMINSPLVPLYQMAYCTDSTYIARNQIIIRAKDPAKLNSSLTGDDYHQWMKNGNGYCYELQVPPELMKNIHDYVRQDLERVLPQYRAKMIDTTVKCLALVRTSKADKIRSKKPYLFEMSGTSWVMNHAPLQRLVSYLAAFYLQGSALPVVNDTGYKDLVDLELSADLTSVSALNTALAEYDLALVEKKVSTTMLILSDHPKP